MNIITTEYNLWRENLNTYYIKNIIGTGNTISLSLYSVKDSTETALVKQDIQDGVIYLLPISDEGVYKLYIEQTSYTIKYFPTLIQSIVDLIQSQICDCNDSSGNKNLNCISVEDSIISQNYYDIQFVSASVNLYLHLLLSQSFTRDYRNCFDIILQDNSTTLLSLIQNVTNNLLLQGNISDSTHLYKAAIAYLYLLLYVIELDTASHTDNIAIPQTNEIKLVEDLFSIKDLNLCFNKLNINSVSVISKLTSCYQSKLFGGDGVCPEFYRGIYYNTKATSEFPTEEEILNGIKYEAPSKEYFSIQLNIKEYEYAWFAIPVDYYDKFTNWEEMGSNLNHSNIGTENSTEFIIVKDTTVLIRGIQYYIYKFNWTGLFTSILKLYIL